jgi:hypothetical protein
MRVSPWRIATIMLGASVTLAAAAAPAAARTIIKSPYGSTTAVDVIIGSKTNSSGQVQQVIVWRKISDSSCKTTVLGAASGLTKDYLVQLSSKNDLVWLPATGWGISDCHGTGGPLTYAGHFLDVQLLGGNDQGNTGGDTILYGGSGNDILRHFAPDGFLLGEAGKDTLTAESASGTAEALDGGDGDDCLQDSSRAAALLDCGAGNDRFAGGASDVVSCETRVDFCPL